MDNKYGTEDKQVKKRVKRARRHHFKSAREGSNPSLDGALHFPELHLLVSSPIGHPCTHAVGDQRQVQEKGLIHGLVSPEVAASISWEEFQAHKKKTRVLRAYDTSCSVTRTDGVRLTRKTYWVEVARDYSVQVPRFISPSRLSVMESTFVTCPEGYDTFALLGQPYLPTGFFHLLQMLFLDRHGIDPLPHKLEDDLLNNMIGRAGRKGLETSRTGGSSGKCSFNHLMKKHLSTPGAFPRHANALLIIILNSPSRCGYFAVYSSPYDEDGKIKSWFYNTPVVGGHQKLLKTQVQQFKLLEQFPSCRVETAQLLMFRNTVRTGMLACPHAADSMMEELGQALLEQHSDCMAGKPESLGYYLAMNSRHTLLCHAVKYHRDVFSDNSGDKIENKILLISRSRSNTTQEIALGRGGAGKGVFVYAILDWTGPSRARRQRYIDLGGDPNERVTQRLLDDFLRLNNLA